MGHGIQLAYWLIITALTTLHRGTQRFHNNAFPERRLPDIAMNTAGDAGYFMSKRSR